MALAQCHVLHRAYLTQCINQMVTRTECIHQLGLESQLPRKTVKFLLELVIVNNKLTILWGSLLPKTIYLNTL